MKRPLRSHYANDQAFQAALSDYLAALEARPDHAPELDALSETAGEQAKRIEDLEVLVANLVGSLATVTERIDTLSTTLDHQLSWAENVHPVLDRARERLDAIEAKVADQAVAMDGGLTGLQTGLGLRIEALEDQIADQSTYRISWQGQTYTITAGDLDRLRMARDIAETRGPVLIKLKDSTDLGTLGVGDIEAILKEAING